MRLPCTPDEVLDVDDRDVIEELFTELGIPPNIKTDIEARMWDRYGFRPLGMWDVDRWVKVTRHVARSNWAWYSRFVDVIKSDEILSTDNVTYSEIIDTQAERQESLISEHDGTTGTTGTRTDTVDGTKRTETEDKPDTPLGDEKYLDSVVEATDDTTTTSESSDNVTVQGSDNTETTGLDSSITTRTGTRSDGTNVSSLKAVIDEYRRVSQMFVEAFESSFMNRW